MPFVWGGNRAGVSAAAVRAGRRPMMAPNAIAALGRVGHAHLSRNPAASVSTADPADRVSVRGSSM